jgi:hypothetical protein
MVEEAGGSPRGLIGCPHDLQHLVVEHQDQQVFLGPGVGEDRAAGDAGGVGDLLRGRGLEPLVGEQGPGRGDDAAALLRTPSICAGSAASSFATASSRRPASPLAC